jgi:hypothetical protein
MDIPDEGRESMSKQPTVSEAEAKVAAKRAAFDRAATELEDAQRELQLAGAAFSAAEREKAEASAE